MLRVRDVMTTDVATVTPETTLREAMELLATRHVSGAPVVQGRALVGVVTALDLMAFAAAMPGVPIERGEPSLADVVAEEPGVDAEVEAGDEPAGAFFSELWDDAGVDAATRMDSLASPEWNALEDHDVSEVMTRPPLVTVAPDASLETAADLMKQHAIHRALVTDGTRLIGIVSAIDVAVAVADHRLTSRRYVFNRDGDFRDRDSRDADGGR